jgi:hypothetical protein
MPPHLQLTLLNVPAADTGASLPRPQHVILGHVYLQRGQVRVGVCVCVCVWAWVRDACVRVPACASVRVESKGGCMRERGWEGEARAAAAFVAGRLSVPARPQARVPLWGFLKAEQQNDRE